MLKLIGITSQFSTNLIIHLKNSIDIRNDTKTQTLPL